MNQAVMKRGVFLAPGLALLLVAIGGRYTLDRAGLLNLAWVDLRVIGLTGALAVLIVDIVRRPKVPYRERAEGWLIVTVLFFLFQIASGLWAPPASRVGPIAVDLVLMAALTVAVYLYAVGDPAAAVRTVFTFFFAAAILFALAAIFINGPGDQGRYSAFGGGPNVFVRIEILGVIAAFALQRLTGRTWPLLITPLFLLAAFLSGSRAGLLAGAVIGAAALWRIRRKIKAGVAIAGVFLLSIAGVVLWMVAPPAFTELFQERFVEQTVEQRYTSGRTDIWEAALKLFYDNPIGGAGLDGFYGAIGVNRLIEYPHNYVLGVAAEGGLVGLILMTTAIVMWIRTVRRGVVGQGGGHPREVLLTSYAAIFVFLSGLFSGDNYDSRLAWLFAALAAASAVTPAVDREPEMVTS